MSQPVEVPRPSPAPRTTSVEKVFERLLYGSRWLLAPIQLGLGLTMLLVIAKFYQELGHLAHEVGHLDASDVTLGVLEFVDLALVGGLIVMVMLSGYENFVSRLELENRKDELDWLGKLDAGGLKQKLAASLVAISSIQLLRIFLDLENVPGERVGWSIALHVTFVLSALGLVAIDRIAKPH